MSSGKTDELRAFSHRYVRNGSRSVKPWVFGQEVKSSDKTPRNRSLNGKARIKARKLRNKVGW